MKEMTFLILINVRNKIFNFFLKRLMEKKI